MAEVTIKLSQYSALLDVLLVICTATDGVTFASDRARLRNALIELRNLYPIHVDVALARMDQVRSDDDGIL
jgi:hypothetical protein